MSIAFRYFSIGLSVVFVTLAIANGSQAIEISNIVFSPASPAVLTLGEYLDFDFEYQVDVDSYIWGRPNRGAYGAHPSPLYLGSSSGTDTGFFRIRDIGQNSVVVDQVRFRSRNADKSQVLLEHYVDVNFTWLRGTEELEELIWHGDQATSNGVASPPVGSFYDDAMWRSSSPEPDQLFGKRVVFEAINTTGQPNQSTQFSMPRTVHFGDIDVAPLAGDLHHKFEFGGDAILQELEIRNSEWTFNFGAFDNYFGVGDFSATERGSLTVEGVAQVYGELLLVDGTMSAGEVQIGYGATSGTLRVGSNATLVSSSIIVGDGGELTGSGDIIGNVHVPQGKVAPGNSPGILNIDGDFHLYSDGELEFEIEGPLAGSQYDQLMASGSIVLAGDIHIEFGSGYVPAPGDTFELFSASAGFDATAAKFIAPSGFELIPTSGGRYGFSAIPEPSSIMLTLLAMLTTRSRPGRLLCRV